MSDERKPLFAECKRCDERWKVGTLPIPCHDLGKMNGRCPNCSEAKEVYVCATHGQNVVTCVRDGKPKEEWK